MSITAFNIKLQIILLKHKNYFTEYIDVKVGVFYGVSGLPPSIFYMLK